MGQLELSHVVDGNLKHDSNVGKLIGRFLQT